MLVFLLRSPVVDIPNWQSTRPFVFNVEACRPLSHLRSTYSRDLKNGVGIDDHSVIPKSRR